MNMQQHPNTIPDLIPSRFYKFVFYLLKIYFGLMRRIGLSNEIPFFIKFPLSYQNKNFEFHIKYQLDFDLIKDTFIKQEYIVHDSDTCGTRTIFDLGSNIGATVVFFKLLWPEATVYAFEPDPRNIESLERNVAQFGESVIVVRKAVVPNRTNRITFYQARRNHWSSSTIKRDCATTELTVPAITLCDAMKTYNISTIDVCKFDIEGGEFEVFSNFNDKDKISVLIGELHYELMRHTKKSSLIFFQSMNL